CKPTGCPLLLPATTERQSYPATGKYSRPGSYLYSWFRESAAERDDPVHALQLWHLHPDYFPHDSQKLLHRGQSHPKTINETRLVICSTSTNKVNPWPSDEESI